MFAVAATIRELQRRNVIRTAAAYLVFTWLVAQIAELLLDAFSAPDSVMRGLVIMLAIGFPIALVLAWVYDITSRGVVRSSEAGQSEDARPLDGRQIDFVIIGVLLLAVALFAADKYRWLDLGADEENADRTIAVLPFEYIAADAESGFFADSITDELIGRLGQIDSVQVKSRLAVARYKETTLDIDQIAGGLGVDYVLEGVIRKVGDRVRVTTQLTDASSGFEEWSDVFDGESTDWFSLHENMAIQIAESLDLHISPTDADAVRSHYTSNADAYAAFWRGWLLLESFHSDVSHPEAKIRAAEKHLNSALELDPEYALAVAGLSMANSYYYFYRVDRTEDRLTRGLALAHKALEMDPDMTEGHVALGMAHSASDDHGDAVVEFRRALNRDSNDAMIWCLLAFSCMLQEPPDIAAAEEAAQISIQHDPTWTYSYQVLGWSLSLQGRYEEAANAYERGVEFNPNYYEVQFGLGGARLALGQYSDALSAFEAAQAIDDNVEVAVYIAAAFTGMGELGRALDSLESGLERGFGDLDAVSGSPYFVPLQDDVRFRTLLDAYRKD